ncbi:MAG: ferrous iron transport protein A [Planctomycetes bacterium]|nr:ferrous iron transport protein A [Planctomycetota bacterium]
MMLVPLHMLNSGESAEIAQLVGVPDHVQRLKELGIRAGERVEMVQPGSPCIIRLAGTRLCFRESDALGVLVKPESGS